MRLLLFEMLADFWVLAHNYKPDIDLPLTAEQKTHINELTQEKARLKDDISKQDEAIDNIFETMVPYDELSSQLQQEIARGKTELHSVTDTDKQYLHEYMMALTHQDAENKEKATYRGNRQRNEN